MRLCPTIFALAFACAAPAFAGESSPPPQGSKPLSDIIGQVEKGPDFGYIGEVEFEDGAYKVEYYSKDGAEHKINIDPMTGKTR